MSDRRTRPMNSRLTGAAANPKRRRSVRQAPKGPFCHAAKREAPAGLPTHALSALGVGLRSEQRLEVNMTPGLTSAARDEIRGLERIVPHKVAK
jgi:hypothetical protein